MTSCRICCREFAPLMPLQSVCSVPCARKVPATARKAAKLRDRARREAAKPRAQWLREAQAEFNAYIRARDAARGCISCGTTAGKINAGHYLSTAARPELRYDELNVHRQCERCNTYLSGNLIAYRAALIDRIGQAAVDAIEGPNPVLRRYTIDELRAIKAKYRARKLELGQRCD